MRQRSSSIVPAVTLAGATIVTPPADATQAPLVKLKFATYNVHAGAGADGRVPPLTGRRSG
jgi:hypothetical protein